MLLGKRLCAAFKPGTLCHWKMKFRLSIYLINLKINNINRPYISSLPRSITMLKTHFPATGIWLKLPRELTILKPGPTLPMAAMDPETDDIMSTPKPVNIMLERKTVPT